MAKKTTEFSSADLKRELDDGKLRPVYLFYGEESYFKDRYERKIIDMIPDAGFPEFNLFRFEGPSTALSDYNDAIESFPMMTDRKLIIIRDCKIFKRANEEVRSFWSEKLDHLSGDTVIVFIEDEVDKRTALYKDVQKIGAAVEFKYLKEPELVTWLLRRALKAKLKMSKDCAQYMIGIVDPGMNILSNEFAKLEAYCTGSITRADIDNVVSKALSTSIFDLTDAIIYKNTNMAMSVLNGLRTSDESALGILYLLCGTAEKMLRLKVYDIKNKYEAKKILNISSVYSAEKYLRGANSLSVDFLIRIVTRVPEIDLEIKTGNAEEWAALEQFISECVYYSAK